MKRSGAVKFPNSVQLFKFCQKVLSHQRGEKIHDQEVGSILEFNPSDCSHWKRGEKSVRSVFSLAKLSEALHVEASLIHDIASGHCDLEEAYFEYMESRTFKASLEQVNQVGNARIAETRAKVQAFVANLHRQSEFTTPPFYLPEVMRFFSFITTQPTDMLDKLSRILRTKPNQYCIQYRKGEMRAQSRMSIAKDFARIIFEAERARYPELGEADPQVMVYEILTFVANLLIPKNMMLDELAKLDSRRNVVADLSALFWVPKSLVGFQMQEVLKSGELLATRRPASSTQTTKTPTANM
jgi:hypothetical protein